MLILDPNHFKMMTTKLKKNPEANTYYIIQEYALREI